MGKIMIIKEGETIIVSKEFVDMSRAEIAAFLLELALAQKQLIELVGE